VQFVKLQGLPLYERKQLYEHSFAFFMTSMRLGMSNRLNMSHLNSGCNLVLHAAQLFVGLTVKILLDARAPLTGDENLSLSRLNTSSRARLDTRTVV